MQVYGPINKEILLEVYGPIKYEISPDEIRSYACSFDNLIPTICIDKNISSNSPNSGLW